MGRWRLMGGLILLGLLEYDDQNREERSRESIVK